VISIDYSSFKEKFHKLHSSKPGTVTYFLILQTVSCLLCSLYITPQLPQKFKLFLNQKPTNLQSHRDPTFFNKPSICVLYWRCPVSFARSFGFVVFFRTFRPQSIHRRVVLNGLFAAECPFCCVFHGPFGCWENLVLSARPLPTPVSSVFP